MTELFPLKRYTFLLNGFPCKSKGRFFQIYAFTENKIVEVKQFVSGCKISDLFLKSHSYLLPITPGGFIPNSDIRDYVFVKVWLLNIWRHLLLAQVIPNYKKCFAWKILLWFVQVHEVSQSGIYHNNFLTCYLNPFLIKATFAFTVDILWGIQVLDRSVL